MQSSNIELLINNRFLRASMDGTLRSILTDFLHKKIDINDFFGMEICHLIDSVPHSEIFTIIDRNKIDKYGTVLLLIFAVKHSRINSNWLLYNITKNLDLIVRQELPQESASLIMYALLTLSSFGPSEEGRPLPLSILARELSHFAPRLAIANGIDAAAMGYIEGLEAAHTAITELGFSASHRPTMTQLQEISSSLDIGVTQKFDVTNSSEATAYSEILFKPSEIRIVAPPREGRSHYIFKNADIPYEMPPIKVHCFDGGLYSIDISYRGRTTFYVFDCDRKCIADLSHGVSPFITNDVLSIDATVCIIDDRYSGSMNICHFIMDRLTRIAAYENNLEDDLVFVIADSYQYYKDLFEIVGLSDKIIYLSDKNTSIACKRLLVSSNISKDFIHPAHSCAPWAMKYLDNLFKTPDKSFCSQEKILISRADTVGRSIINWPQVVELCSKFGFIDVSLSDMSVESQIDLFKRADHVIGVHGAGLTNIIFASRSCKVLEILPPLVATEAYWRLAMARGQAYNALIAEDPSGIKPDYLSWPHDPANNFHDVIVPLDSLRRYLEENFPQKVD